MSNNEEDTNPYEISDQLHEDMLKQYIEYYNHWDNWVQRRSFRTYYKTQKAAKELHRIMKAHNRALTKDFYKVKQLNSTLKK